MPARSFAVVTCDCNREFVDDEALMNHLRDKIHGTKSPARPGKNIPCGSCKKLFKSMKAAKSHRASPVHKPLGAPLQCIESNLCKKIFIFQRGLLLSGMFIYPLLWVSILLQHIFTVINGGVLIGAHALLRSSLNRGPFYLIPSRMMAPRLPE